MNNDLASTPNGYSNNGTLKLNGYSGSLRSANTSTVKSKIPTSSRNSSRESSPGRRSSKILKKKNYYLIKYDSG